MKIIDNKIIFCATNGSGQDPFYFDDNLPILDTAPKIKKDILNSLKIYQPKIAKGKDVEIEKAIRKVSANGKQLENLDDKLTHEVINDNNISTEVEVIKEI